MSLIKIDKIRLSGISACVPKKIQKNSENEIFESDDDAVKFISTTGVKERRIADLDVCTSDLTVAATNKLIDELGWDLNDIGILICVTQTPDFHGPMNSSLIQHRLGLNSSCIVFDIPVGCSGFVYGTSVLSSMMKSFQITKGLLLVGDTLSKQASPKDKSTQPLFGDAGCAAAFELSEDPEDLFVFDLGGDGSGWKSLYLKDGGYRHPFNIDSLNYSTNSEGLTRNGCHTIMEGMDVFSFGITTAPKTVNNVLEYCGLSVNEIDAFVFHQANLFMNEKIRKKLKIEPEKFPYSIDKFGNTSSATIPLTLVSELKNQLENGTMNLILCGFGIGLSWGTMKLTTKKIVCVSLLEI